MDTDKFLKDYLLTYNDYNTVKKQKIKKVLIIIFILFLVGIYFRPLTYLKEKIEYNATNAKKNNEYRRRNSKASRYLSDFRVYESAPKKKFEKSNLEYKGKYPMPIKGTVTSWYGYRTSPFNSGKSDFHTGIDISGYKHHAEVSSVEKGTVVFAGVQRGYGNCILIHNYGEGEEFYTMYAHLSKIYVNKGDKVDRGTVIALEGGGKGDPNPGYSTGHHLHFEVRMNESIKSTVNPSSYIF